MNPLKINAVITDSGVFINDTVNGYSSSTLERFFIDGEKPKRSHVKNWFVIDEMPVSIKRQEPDSRKYKQWELIDPDMESKALPLIVEYDELSYDNSIADLYTLDYEVVPGELVDIPFEVEVITEVKNFRLPPKVDYTVKKKDRARTVEVVIDNTNFEHQLLDKLIIPEVLIHEYPCKLPSSELYQIVRQHIKENIDTRHARITSDYDFCFKVRKIVPIVGPGKIDHNSLMDGTFYQKESLIKEEEFDIFEMTSENERYKGYTPIKGISANNQTELKEKIDKFLDELMKFINEPTGKEY